MEKGTVATLKYLQNRHVGGPVLARPKEQEVTVQNIDTHDQVQLGIDIRA